MTTEENIQAILSESLYLDKDLHLSKIVQGTVAQDFQNYLTKNTEKDERNIEKFYFLLLTEIVLACKNKNDQGKIFDHLTHLFFSENGKLKDSLRFPNAKLGEKLYSFTRRNKERGTTTLQEDAIKLLKKAKESNNIWEGDKGLVPIYMDFHDEISRKPNFCACLLSIL